MLFTYLIGPLLWQAGWIYVLWYRTAGNRRRAVMRSTGIAWLTLTIALAVSAVIDGLLGSIVQSHYPLHSKPDSIWVANDCYGVPGTSSWSLALLFTIVNAGLLSLLARRRYVSHLARLF